MHKATELLRELTCVHSLTSEEAETLVASLLRRARHTLYLEKAEIQEADYRRILSVVKLLKRNVPIQYLLKEAYFFNWRLHVEEGVFIPRPETEGLVSIIAETAPDTVETIVDVGTGTGCIAIALASRFVRSTVHALDVSEPALKVARMNLERHHLTSRVRTLRSDLLGALDHSVRADIIVSNPPYIRTTGIPQLPESVRCYEPWAALDGGNDGIAVIKRLLDQAPPFLRTHHLIGIEIDEYTVGPLETYLRRSGFARHFRFERDLAGLDRYLIIESP